MPYQNALALLTQTFRKSHVPIKQIPAHSLNAAIDQSTADLLASIITDLPASRLPAPQHHELYHYTDAHTLCYTYLLLPAGAQKQILLIGPYLRHAPEPEQLLELSMHLGLSAQAHAKLAEYAMIIPVLDRENPLFLLLDSFCEQIWHSPSFSIVDVNLPHERPASFIHQPLHTDNFDDVLLNMKAMEQRYTFENDLIRAVTLGQLHVESQLLATVSDQQFERRVADPLRNNKNYCIIMNTLLRKAAENGGVHPLYIDRVSSEFAHRIEQMTKVNQIAGLMQDIFRGYCLLVQQHSLRNYSRVVQTAILLIDSDLSADLSLHSLACNQGISPGYLSTVFKEETGKTVTAYIREKRMRHACHLLGSTNLQIQTVALHCGMPDVHYFTKTFKKEIGMTPKQYRESLPGMGKFPI